MHRFATAKSANGVDERVNFFSKSASCFASSFVPPSSSRISMKARTTKMLMRTAFGLFKMLAAITAPFSVKA